MVVTGLVFFCWFLKVFGDLWWFVVIRWFLVVMTVVSKYLFVEQHTDFTTGPPWINESGGFILIHYFCVLCVCVCLHTRVQ